MEGIKQAIQAAANDLFSVDEEPVLTRPDEQFGDYATNIALQLAAKLNKKPREIADAIAERLLKTPDISKVEVAGPGFINLTLTDAALLNSLKIKLSKGLAGTTVVVEYSDPNPFKVLHAGHLYTSVVGDAIANLLEAAGAIVHRVNFGGDVGLHVGKTMWAIIKRLDGEHPEKLTGISEDDRSDWLTEAYVEGTKAYELNDETKAEIVELNKRVYQLFADNDHDSPFAQIYWTTRQWSYDYFGQFYAQIGSKFEKFYPESETAGLGLKTVKEHLGDVFEESNGAVVFNGEKYGLHTRVFINSEGLPTYEAKDVGLIMRKYQDYHFDKSVIVTGNDIVEYMKVVLKAVEQFAPELAKATTHLTHGIVKLKGGEKMSSRKGNILRAVDLLQAAATANKTATGKDNDQIVLGAVKYAFLKQRIGGDIIYHPDESVNLEGNSGPYLQYALVRAKSILQKSSGNVAEMAVKELETGERALVRKLSEFPEVVETAIYDLLPSHVCTYLYELAQTFNRFYENNRVIDNERESVRLYLVKLYSETLKRGLDLLNVPVLERM